MHTETPRNAGAYSGGLRQHGIHLHIQGGVLPKMYILMHSNTGQLARRSGQRENEKHIRRLFQMNFNRGQLFNTRNSSILTYAYAAPSKLVQQPPACAFRTITKHSVSFVTGDNAEAANWAYEGVAEYVKMLLLNPEPDGYGRMTPQTAAIIRTLVSLSLTGKLLGNQRYDTARDSSLRNGVTCIENNQFVVARPDKRRLLRSVYNWICLPLTAAQQSPLRRRVKA